MNTPIRPGAFLKRRRKLPSNVFQAKGQVRYAKAKDKQIFIRILAQSHIDYASSTYKYHECIRDTLTYSFRAPSSFFNLHPHNSKLNMNASDNQFSFGLVAQSFLEQEEYSYLLNAAKAGCNVYNLGAEVVVPQGFKFQEWVANNFHKYYLTAAGCSMIAYKTMPSGDIRMDGYVSDRDFSYNVSGPRKAVEETAAWLQTVGFERNPVSVKWFFNSGAGINSHTLPLQILPRLEGAYPWLKNGLDPYIDSYLASNSSVLILIGPPGTGKTSFIKELIARANTSATVTYDTSLLDQDGFFAGFMQGSSSVLVIEDADTFIQSRRRNNSMMHRFLNASDGLVSFRDKKIIITTNLPNTQDIDEALLRPGRCFDVLDFRRLTKEEAKVVASNFGVPPELVVNDNYSLAEVTHLTKDADKVKSNIGSIGFIKYK